MSYTSPLFLMYFSEGYSFRHIWTILGQIEVVTMVVSPETIKISYSDDNACWNHLIVIDTDELSDYYYNIYDSDGNLVPDYPVTFNFQDMVQSTKTVGRKDSLKVSLMPGEHRLNLQPIKDNKELNRTGALFVNLLLDVEHYFYSSSRVLPPKPTIRIQSRTFTNICNEITNMKCSSMEMIESDDGVVIKGILPNGKNCAFQKFRKRLVQRKREEKKLNLNIDYDVLDNYQTDSLDVGLDLEIVDTNKISLSKQVVQSLSKLNNLSSGSCNLRIYFFDDGATITSAIGTSHYGVYYVHIYN